MEGRKMPPSRCIISFIFCIFCVYAVLLRTMTDTSRGSSSVDSKHPMIGREDESELYPQGSGSTVNKMSNKMQSRRNNIIVRKRGMESIGDVGEMEKMMRLMGENSKRRRRRRRYMMMSKSMSMSKSSRQAGSWPPRCISKCGKCTPCKPVHVPVPPGTPVITEYYPEAWMCKCGNNLYLP